jgi:hypothetical protein
MWQKETVLPILARPANPDVTAAAKRWPGERSAKSPEEASSEIDLDGFDKIPIGVLTR